MAEPHKEARAVISVTSDPGIPDAPIRTLSHRQNGTPVTQDAAAVSSAGRSAPRSPSGSGAQTASGAGAAGLNLLA